MSNPFIKTVPTQEQMRASKLTALVGHLNMNGANQLQSLLQLVKTGWETVWENNQFTPAEILAEMGTNAVETFRTTAIIAAAIYAIDPTLLDEKCLSAKLPYTANDNGRITLN